MPNWFGSSRTAALANSADCFHSCGHSAASADGSQLAFRIDHRCSPLENLQASSECLLFENAKCNFAFYQPKLIFDFHIYELTIVNSPEVCRVDRVGCAANEQRVRCFASLVRLQKLFDKKVFRAFKVTQVQRLKKSEDYLNCSSVWRTVYLKYLKKNEI